MLSSGALRWPTTQPLSALSLLPGSTPTISSVSCAYSGRLSRPLPLVCAAASRACSTGPWLKATAPRATIPRAGRATSSICSPLRPTRSSISQLSTTSEVPTFLRELAKQDTITARAIELLILTATRTGSIIDATWEQVDTTAARTWSIPKTKNGNALTVPLTDAALAVLARVPAGAPADKIFPARNGQLSPNALLAALKRINPDVTVHGFRAAFKTWADEETDFPRDLVEVAMAHKVGNDVERSYQRGEKLEKRRKLMADWSAYCTTTIAA